jgi:hypothetical protein
MYEHLLSFFVDSQENWLSGLGFYNKGFTFDD